MNDLISRQAAIDAILRNEEVYSNHFGDDPIDRYTVAIIDNDAQTLAQLPTIDPVKHGKWIKDGDTYALYKCSECNDFCTAAGYADWIPEEQMYKAFKFCPNCGAKMGKEENHGR